MDKNMRLGRGLSALMGDDEEVFVSTSALVEKINDGDIIMADLNGLVPSPFQPRRVFLEEALSDLISSIREKGVLQPLLVRKNPNQTNGFEIIAGERRFRASKIAGLTHVPVIVKDFTDKDALEVALIENLQREDLNPLEEAEAYKKLLKEFRYTQEELSKVVGKSRSHLANMLRLLDMPEELKQMVEQKEITVGHAKALLTAAYPVDLAHEVVKQGLSVRQVEKMVSDQSGHKSSKQIKPQKIKSDALKSVEKELSDLLKTTVLIKGNEGKGQLIVSYQSIEALDFLIKKLKAGE